MYGFEAISSANGWMISLFGILIVFTGLVFLALLISGIPKVIEAWEKRKDILAAGRFFRPEERARIQNGLKGKRVPVLQSEPPPVLLTRQQQEVAAGFEMLTDRLGECFSLPLLLEQAEKRGIYKPHSHTALFLRLGLFEECEGDITGFYRWKKQAYKG